MRHIVILGGGTGGTTLANHLRRSWRDDEAELTVVDQDDGHVYQPGLLLLPFGQLRPRQIVRSRRRQLRRGISYHQSAIDSVDVDEDRVSLADGTVLNYDVLSSRPGRPSFPTRPRASSATAGGSASSPSPEERRPTATSGRSPRRGKRIVTRSSRCDLVEPARTWALAGGDGTRRIRA
jgi:hypothetical protein